MEVFWFALFWGLVLVVIFALPLWPHASAKAWGYTPSAIAAGIAVLLVILYSLGAISVWAPWGPGY